MRRLSLLPLLLLAVLFLGACEDVSGLGGRSLDGQWVGRVEGEEVWLSLRDDGGEIRGSGDWGYDEVFVTGERYDEEVYLVFEFDTFNPIELEGEVVNRQIEGRLYGSGLNGERVLFRRD